MAKGHIEIHDPISSHKDLEGSTEGGDAASPSDADNMEDTVEFRVMMAFAQRRRPRKNPQTPKEDQIQDQVQIQDPVVTNGHTDSNGTSSPQTTPAQTGTDVTQEKKKKKQKKKVWKRLRSLLCVKPETQDEGEPQKKSPEMPQNLNFRCGHFGDGARRDSAGDKPEEEDEFSDVAKQLTKLAAEIPFTPPELETDAPDDVNVERMIGLLLRESGDQLNEKELKDIALAKELFWNYSFFRTLMSALLTRMGLRSPNPESPGPHASPKTQIAVTCEATSRLSALSPLPANRLLGHGARYLNEYFSSWVQEQGGYDAAFEDDEDEDEVQ